MSKWRSYSYIDLAPKGFDCLSYLACAVVFFSSSVVIRKTNGVYNATAFLNCSFSLVPVAEVKPGVFIRGDKLLGSLVGNSIATQPALPSLGSGNLTNYRGDRAGTYVFQHYKQGTSIQAGATCSRAFSRDPAGTSRWLRATYTQSNAGAFVPFVWDSGTGEASFVCDVPVSDIASQFSALFASEFSGAALNLDTSQISPVVITANCPASDFANYSLNYNTYQTGDPVTAPIFKIPFI